MPQPTLDALIRADLDAGVLTVDTETGRVWRGRRPSMMLGHRYLRTSLSGSRLALTHRVVWIAAHGSVPDGCEIDHINGDRFDNRLCNLQAIPGDENTRRYYRGDHLDHERPSDEIHVDPQVVAEARALAASGAGRDAVRAFIEHARETRSVA